MWLLEQDSVGVSAYAADINPSSGIDISCKIRPVPARGIRKRLFLIHLVLVDHMHAAIL